MTGIVYHIFNTVNGKAYVGQTWDSLDNRWKQHCMTNCEMIVVRAIRKYGPAAFVMTALAACKNQMELDAAEDAFIVELGTLFPDGYNLKRGGAHGKHTTESRRKMSESHKGQKPSVNSAFGKDYPRWNKGKTSCFSEETLVKMKLAKLGKPRSEAAKKAVSEGMKLAWAEGRKRHK